MDLLFECVKSFEELLNIEYNITIGRKGKSANLCIEFKKIDFHHLMGLGKLKDLRIASQNRENVFDEILAGKITYEIISKSRYIQQIQYDKLNPLPLFV
jgi:hypothetical protein